MGQKDRTIIQLLLISLAAVLLTACATMSTPPTPTAVVDVQEVEPAATEVPPTETAVPPTETSEPTETPVPPTPIIEPTATTPPTATALPPLSGSGGGVIAFTSEQEGVPGIHIMNGDGTDQRRLTNSFDSFATWSPDGSQIAFTTKAGGNTGISIIDILTGDITVLIEEEGPSGVVWSPDGKSFAFSKYDPSPGVAFEIFTMDASGRNIKQLTETLQRKEKQYLNTNLAPDWSPDGSKLLFSSDKEGPQNIYVMDSDGSNLVQLTSNEVDDRMPVWSPDGNMIAFESYRDGNWEIHIMNADGSGVRNISNSPDREQWPSWSPDGSKIAFQTDRDGNWEIYVMNADGSNPQRLTDNDVKDTEPAWRP